MQHKFDTFQMKTYHFFTKSIKTHR